MYIPLREVVGTNWTAVKTYVTADEVVAGIDPRLLRMLQVSKDQLRVTAPVREGSEQYGPVAIKILNMRCLICHSPFNSFVGDTYICRACKPSAKFSANISE